MVQRCSKESNSWCDLTNLTVSIITKEFLYIALPKRHFFSGNEALFLTSLLINRQIKLCKITLLFFLFSKHSKTIILFEFFKKTLLIFILVDGHVFLIFAACSPAELHCFYCCFICEEMHPIS